MAGRWICSVKGLLHPDRLVSYFGQSKMRSEAHRLSGTSPARTCIFPPRNAHVSDPVCQMVHSGGRHGYLCVSLFVVLRYWIRVLCHGNFMMMSFDSF
jgi:hypothetical protein